MGKTVIKTVLYSLVISVAVLGLSFSSFALEETSTVPSTTAQTQEETTTVPSDESETESTTEGTEESTTAQTSVLSGFVEQGGKLFYFLSETAEKFIPESAGVYSIDGKAYLFSSDGSVAKYNPEEPIITCGEDRYIVQQDNSLASGLQKSGEKFFWFDEETFRLTKGWVVTEEGKRCFGAEDGSMLTGLGVYGNNTYYFGTDGIMKTGWVDLKDGRRRFHLKTGAMLTGLKTFSGNTYYFNSKGIMQTGWVKFSKGKRCFNAKTGAMLKGKKAYGGKYYYFNNSGFMKTGWVTISKDKYYFSKKNGVMLKGWNKIDSKYYYFNSNGKMAKNTIVGDYYVLSDGTRATSSAVKYAVKAVNSATTSKMTKEEKLKACYNWIIRNFRYERDYTNPETLKYNWTKSYAEYSFKNKKGNCYKYASAMGYCAEVLGYQAKVVCGKIASGNSMTNHGWTEIVIDGKTYLFDTVQADHYSGNFYKRTYSNYPKKLSKSSSKAIVLS